MTKVIYLTIYTAITLIVGVQAVANLGSVGTSLSQGNEIAQLKYEQRQLQLEQQQLQQALANKAAVTQLSSTVEEDSEFTPVSTVAIVSPATVALNQ